MYKQTIGFESDLKRHVKIYNYKLYANKLDNK